MMIIHKASKSQKNKSFLVNENDLVQFYESDFEGKMELFFAESNTYEKIVFPKTKTKELFVSVFYKSKFRLDDLSRVANHVYNQYSNTLPIAEYNKLQVAGFE